MARLLFDQNVAARLVVDLSDLFPESRNTSDLGLSRAADDEIFAYAKEHGYVVVSKDSDFRHWSFLFGFPPKVIWIRLGNAATGEIEALLRARFAAIQAFLSDEEAAILGLA